MRRILFVIVFTTACHSVSRHGVPPGEADAAAGDVDAAAGDLDAGPPGGPDAAVDDGTLTVVLEGPGGGVVASSPAGIDCGDTCTASFTPGTTVSITATPDAVSRFAGWSDDCSGSSSTCPLVVDGPRLATATFERLPVPVTVTLDGDGDGEVTSTPAGIDCGSDCEDAFVYGSTVVLGAAADDGSSFTGWTGDCTGTGPCVLTMDGAKTVTATFTADCEAPPTIVGSAGTSTVTVPPGCHAATVKAWGAAGGGYPFNSGFGGGPYDGGGGGFATAKILTTPGEVLQITVGAGGAQASVQAGAGGGGASGVIRGVTPIVIAGGGGGACGQAVGGGGGGTSGGAGAFPSGATIAMAGGGASQASPGTGGTTDSGGSSGAAGVGANGGNGGTNSASGNGGGGAGGSGWGTGGTGGSYAGGGSWGGGGGGGGGGYLGGGGGSGSGWYYGGGGGGGSSYIDHPTNTATMTTAATGATPPNTGDAHYAAGVAEGGTGAGGNGRVVVIWLAQ